MEYVNISKLSTTEADLQSEWLVQCFMDGRGFTFDQLRSGLRTQRWSSLGVCLEHIFWFGFI